MQKGPENSQVKTILETANEISFFHTPDGEGYGVIPMNGHRETWPIKSTEFQNWIVHDYFEKYKEPPYSGALNRSLKVLEAKAKFSGPELEVFVRVASHGLSVFIDLCNEGWEIFEISPEGWKINPDPPVRFKRTRGMRPLPHPIKGGSLDDLHRLINAPDEKTWLPCVSWLLATMRHSGPFPILNILATQGGGKSTMGRVVRDLIDPSAADLRCPPRTERDLLIAANNSWVLAFDNLSEIKEWQSDAFCRLATGGGISTRKLYTDADEYIANPMRPIIINGIDYLPNREDFLDRSMIIHLPQIPDKERIPERELWGNFHKAQPYILGVMFDVVSSALSNLPNTKLGSYPRLADFAQWVVSGEKALNWEEGSFLRIYEENRKFAIEDSLEGSQVASAIRKMLERKKSSEGTATDLLKELEKYAPERDQKSRSWPKSASDLSGLLRRTAPSLLSIGIDVTFWREAGTGRRKIKISREDSAES